MVIKKFSGKSEEEACELAKKELGEGFVIMNVKNVKPKGAFSFLKAKRVEVTAAVEDQKDVLNQAKKELRNVAQTIEAAQNAAAQNPLFRNGAPQNMGGQNIQTTENVADFVDVQLSGVSNKGLGQGVNTGNIEKKLDSLQTLLESQLNRDEGRTRNNAWEAGEDAEEEPAGIYPKEEETAQSPETEEQEKFFKLLYNTMIENEVDEKYADEIIEEARKNSKPNIPFDYILANIYQKLILKFGKSDGIESAQKGPRTIFFIGPTGVGKTTSIAKVASNLVVDEKKKVALLTSDTYRIAAAEQLHTYANILEVPFRVIYTEEELVEALKAYRDYDYIFVDTAGHSHQNREQMDELKNLIDSVAKVTEYQAFLVLSATTKYKDLLKIAEQYREVTEYQLIFTKLDETLGLGNLINVKLHMNIPIAYVAYGQNVPNDIEVFNPQKTVKQILGGKSQ